MRVEHHLADLFHEAGEGETSLQAAAKDDHVRKAAYNLLKAELVAAGDRGAHQDVVLSAVTVQEHLIGGQQQSEESDASAAARLPSAAASGGSIRKLTAGARSVCTAEYGRSVGRSSKAVTAQLPAPIVPKPFTSGAVKRSLCQRT